MASEIRKCLCLVEYKSTNGYLYTVGVEYKVYNMRKHYDYNIGEGMYYEMLDSKNFWRGYILEAIFNKHFIFEDDILEDIDKRFHIIMNGS